MDDIYRHKSLHEFWDDSLLAGQNAAYLEDLYDRFLSDPNQVSGEWRAFFETLPRVNGHGAEVRHSAIREAFRNLTRQAAAPRRAVATQPGSTLHEERQVRVLQLINAYRFRGHQIAKIDPLELQSIPDIPELNPEFHGLGTADMDTLFDTGSFAGMEKATLREILDRLHAVYCESVGSEYMHITETTEKRWIQQRLEHAGGRVQFSNAERLRILQRLTAAEGLERYLHTRYVGQKRFSLEELYDEAKAEVHETHEFLELDGSCLAVGGDGL